MYEYFASGKPVVTTAIKEIQQFSNVMYYSKTSNDFVKNVGIAIREHSKNKIALRKKVAKQNTWTKRALTLHNEINKLGIMVYNRGTRKI